MKCPGPASQTGGSTLQAENRSGVSGLGQPGSQARQEPCVASASSLRESVKVKWWVLTGRAKLLLRVVGAGGAAGTNGAAGPAGADGLGLVGAGGAAAGTDGAGERLGSLGLT